MVIGFLLVVLILILFLFEWRVALISAISIPLSLVAAGLVLSWTGATINTMILAGLVISLGVLVDDAIIDVENIVRRIRQHRLEGSTKSTASIVLDASVEVRGPIVQATMIILVSTVPIFLLGGLTGSFFRPMALAYGLAILASLLVALTVIPALALILLAKAPIERRESPLVRWLQRGYTALLARIIPRPTVAYATVALVMAVGVLVVPLLGQNLFPAFKERDFLMHWVVTARHLPGGERPHHGAGQQGASGDPGSTQLRRPHRTGHAVGRGRRTELHRELDQHRPERGLRQDVGRGAEGRRRLPGHPTRRADLPEGAYEGGAHRIQRRRRHPDLRRRPRPA